MSRWKNLLCCGVFTACALFGTAPGVGQAAGVDGSRIFHTAFQAAFATQDVQPMRTKLTLYSPTFHLEVSLIDEWRPGTAWMGGQLKWNHTNLNTGVTTKEAFPVYGEMDQNKLSFYGERSGRWYREEVMKMPMFLPYMLINNEIDVTSAVKSVELRTETDTQKHLQVVLDGRKTAALVREYNKRNTGEQQEFTEYLAQGLEMTDLNYFWVVDKHTFRTITLSADLTPLMQNYGKAVLQASYESKLTLNEEESKFYQAIGYYCNLKIYSTLLDDPKSPDAVNAYGLGRQAKASPTVGNVFSSLKRTCASSTLP